MQVQNTDAQIAANLRKLAKECPASQAFSKEQFNILADKLDPPAIDVASLAAMIAAL